MSLEVILWIVSFFVFWEGLYILFVNKYSASWHELKVASFMLTIFFFGVQLVILTGNDENLFPIHYDRLIWEAGIFLAVFVFLKINKGIYEYINRKGGKRIK